MDVWSQVKSVNCGGMNGLTALVKSENPGLLQALLMETV
jgi:hypothetical protein